MQKKSYEKLLAVLDTKKEQNHDWFLSLLDDEKQRAYEDEHIDGVMQMLRIARIRPHKKAINEAREEITALEKEEDNKAENYKKIRELLAKITREEETMQTFRPFFDEPYFARMDLIDNIEGIIAIISEKRGT